MKDENRLAHLENVIQKKSRSFYEIGCALQEIRDDRLYRRLLYKTFEAYTRDRWEIAKSQAYRLIEASRVIDNLSPIGDILPDNESQVRHLARLDPIKQRQIWRDFLNTGMEQNSKNIRKFIAESTPKNHVAQTDATDRISVSYKAAANAMLEEIRRAQNDGWKTTSRESGLFWNRVMKEKIMADALHRKIAP